MAAQEPHHPAALGYADFAATGVYEAASGHDLYILQSRMEMLGFPSKQHHLHNPNALLVAGEGSYGQPRQLLVDDPMRWLFPVNGNELQCQGLSLSLYNPDPPPGSGVGAVTGIEFQQNYSFSAPSAGHKPRGSKYLVPAQELLNEFCNLGGTRAASKKKPQNRRWEEGGSSSSSPINLSLKTLDFLYLQKRKTKLLSLLEEVERRYNKYCEKMRAVVATFEAVAGEGAATAYLALASKAMSRHFRCLRDGIVGQIQAAKKTMGEKDPIAPGMSRGETPRLKLLDRCFRQQKAFEQRGGMMQPYPWRPQRGLPECSVSILRAWLFEHFLHPYPNDVDKCILARQTGLSRSQVSNWFINARVRLWKPMIEELYMEESKADQEEEEDDERNPKPNPNPTFSRDGADELFGDPESLSSIVNAGGLPARRDECYGSADIDFSLFTLTLGLQQHAENPPAIFYSRGHMEECHSVQFSVDGEMQTLPHRNLMGSQLLHDLADQKRWTTYEN